MANDYEIFKGKNLSDLFQDIYINQKSKKKAINLLIDDLKKYMKSAGYAAAIGAVVKDLIDTSVKNDDALIKMAQIVQRLMASETKSSGDDGFLTEAEKKQLIEDLKDTVGEDTKKTDSKIQSLKGDISEIKESMAK